MKQVKLRCDTCLWWLFFLNCVLFYSYKTQHNTELTGLCKYIGFDLFSQSHYVFHIFDCKNAMTYLIQLKEFHRRCEVLESIWHFGSISVLYDSFTGKTVLCAFKIVLYCV